MVGTSEHQVAVADPSSQRPSRSSRWLGVAAGIAATAAAILLMFNLWNNNDLLNGGESSIALQPSATEPQLLAGNSEVNDAADTPTNSVPDNGEPSLADVLQGWNGGDENGGNEAEPKEDASQYVGGDGFRVSMALVLDVVPTAEAYKNNVIEYTLAGCGLPTELPIAMNDEIRSAVNESLMIQNAATENSGAKLYFVYGDDASIGAATEQLYTNLTDLPRLHLNVSFDEPTIGLLNRIASDSGDRLGFDNSFTVPIAPENPFTGIPSQGMLVSSSSRTDSSSIGSYLTSEGQSCFLLIVRVPN